MIELNGILAFVEVLEELKEHGEKDIKHHVLEHAGKTIQDEAKRMIGHENVEWPPLAESTLRRKGANTPLLETGQMRDSISYTVDEEAGEVHIGSNEEKALVHELGTRRIPPRPFLSSAAMHKEKELVEAIGVHTVKVLTGGRAE